MPCRDESRTGTLSAQTTFVVMPRVSLPAVALIVALLATSGVAVSAAPAHAGCALHHACGRGATLTCCCTSQDESSRQNGPTEARVQAAPPLLTPAPLLPATVPCVRRDLGLTALPPLRPGGSDLPTFLATLLI